VTLRSVALAMVATLSVAHAEPRAAGWELRVPERLEVVAGAGGALAIEVSVDRGLAISKAAAILLDLAPDSAVGLKRRRLGRTDAVDPDADSPRFSVAFRADTPGDYAMRVRLRFWLCGQKVCRPAEARRNVVISVTAPVAPAIPPSP
jgi:hypothetical protein